HDARDAPRDQRAPQPGGRCALGGRRDARAAGDGERAAAARARARKLIKRMPGAAIFPPEAGPVSLATETPMAVLSPPVAAVEGLCPAELAAWRGLLRVHAS